MIAAIGLRRCGTSSVMALLAVAASAAADDPRGATKAFQVRHQLSVNLPPDAKEAQIWFTLPQAVPEQRVSNLQFEAPAAWRKVKDSQNNEYAYLEIRDPKEAKVQIIYTFDLERTEESSKVDAGKSRPLNDAERRELAVYLQPDRHVMINDDVRKLAADIVGDEKNPVLAARKIYDWVLNNIEYWVKDPKHLKASAVGSTEYCLTSRTGNCTDFHSLYASLARAAGIPTRIIYGSLFKPELEGQDVDQSYHCWVEFYAPQCGWVPLDVAVANIFKGQIAIDDSNRTLVSRTTATGYQGPDAKLVDYYFGNLDARRVTWSRGRDLLLQPPPAGGPVNAMSRAYIEVDGKELPASQWVRKLTYREVKK